MEAIPNCANERKIPQHPRRPACSNLPRLVCCGRAGTCRTGRTFPAPLRSVAVSSERLSSLSSASLCWDWRRGRAAFVWRRPMWSSSGQAIEIEEEDGGGIERQELAQREPADDGVAERLADLGA